MVQDQRRHASLRTLYGGMNSKKSLRVCQQILTQDPLPASRLPYGEIQVLSSSMASSMTRLKIGEFSDVKVNDKDVSCGARCKMAATSQETH